MGHFMKDCPKINGNSAQFVFEGYEDAGALVVYWLEDEEMCLTLRMMPSGAVIVWRVLNTQHQPGEAVVRILMISLERRR